MGTPKLDRKMFYRKNVSCIYMLKNALSIDKEETGRCNINLEKKMFWKRYELLSFNITGSIITPDIVVLNSRKQSGYKY